MENKKQYAIYVGLTKQRIPVSEEVFKEYMRENDTYRKRMQRSGECKCPSDKRTGCDTDCENCRYYKPQAKTDSLDMELPDQENPEDDYCDITESTNSEPWDFVGGETRYARQERVVKILARMRELMPEAEQVGEMRLKGMNMTQIAKELGVSNNQLVSRLFRLKRVLKKEFRDWI